MASGLVVLIAASLAITQGSESSHGSAEESGEIQDNEDNNVKTGAQHKFWMPTYPGANPLNRRKISITTSEIQKYDRSIDVSLSGVHENKTKLKTKKDETYSMPLIWSGDNIPINKSEHMMISMDSNEISLESSEIKTPKPSNAYKNTDETSSKSNSNELPHKKSKIKSENMLKPTLYPRKKIKKQIKKDKLFRESNHVTTKKYVEKEITSQFFNELNKGASEDPKLTPEYYKKMVKAATENTKKKLGFKDINKPQTQVGSAPSSPEIIAVDINSKSLEKSQKDDEIVFETRHEQFSVDVHRMKGDKKVIKSKQKDSNKTKRVQSLKKVLIENVQNHDNEDKEFKVVRNITQNFTNTTSKLKVPEDSFTSFCDYSAWSDVLARNKTIPKRKKGKQKPTTVLSSYKRSQEVKRKGQRKRIEKKTDKFKQKESKLERKTMRRSDNKTIRSSKRKEKEQFYDDDYDEDENDYDEDEKNYDKSGKKIRMRTQGEKRHAYREVKDYLKKMDEKYGKRPGGETYQKKYKEKDFKQGNNRGRERRRGRTYGYKERSREEWNSREGRGPGDRRTYRKWDDQGRGNRGAKRYEDRGNHRRDYRDDRRGEGRKRNFRDRKERDYREGKGRDFKDRRERDFRGRRERDFRDRKERDFSDRGERGFRDRRERDFRDRRDRDFRDRRGRGTIDRKGRDFRDRRGSDRRDDRSSSRRDRRRGREKRG